MTYLPSQFGGGLGKHTSGGAGVNRISMTGTLVLTAADDQIQSLDPDGAVRFVDLPVASSGAPLSIILNRSTFGADTPIIVRDGGVPIKVIMGSRLGWFINDGVEWAEFQDGQTPSYYVLAFGSSAVSVPQAWGDIGVSGTGVLEGSQQIFPDDGEIEAMFQPPFSLQENSVLSLDAAFDNPNLQHSINSPGAYEKLSIPVEALAEMRLVWGGTNETSGPAFLVRHNRTGRGLVLGYGGDVDTTNDLPFAWGPGSSVVDTTVDYTKETVVPEDGTLLDLTWNSANANSSTQMDLYIDGINVQTLTLTGTSGTVSINRAVSKQNRIALRYNGTGTTPQDSVWNITTDMIGIGLVFGATFDSGTQDNRHARVWATGAVGLADIGSGPLNFMTTPLNGLVAVSLVYRSENTLGANYLVNVHKNGFNPNIHEVVTLTTGLSAEVVDLATPMLLNRGDISAISQEASNTSFPGETVFMLWCKLGGA